MELIEQIKKYAESIPAEIKERRGIYKLEFVLAERKSFLSRQKIQYIEN